MSDVLSLTATRRRLLRHGVLALGGLVRGGWLPARPSAQMPNRPELVAHLADVSGDGRVGLDDLTLIQNALFTRRGSDLRPAADFDVRADVLGRGQVDREAVNAVRSAVERLATSQDGLARRPITVAWHYGWYNHVGRPVALQTVRFKGGDYASWDPEVETLFNDQKNEFGVTVDALSWIPLERNSRLADNYRRGLFQSANLETRHLALLYESTIALPAVQGRVDFRSAVAQTSLQQHFDEMAQFLRVARDQHGARVFTLNGRPVMFIFGTHVWGLLPVRDSDYEVLEDTFGAAREAFRRAYGEYPYVVGEEVNLSAREEYSPDRRRRVPLFDAIHVYHHASSLKPPEISGRAANDVVLEVTRRYLDNQVGILEKAYQTVDELRNLYTGQRVLVIPNLAPGFAKPGLPTLSMGRREYADFMRRLQDVHVQRYVQGPWADALGTAALPAPVYIVGSWNEEFEGHAVFPAEFNFSVREVTDDGFELVLALKEVFGWNHYAQRPIGS